jgi:RNA polymerase sigma-70 factor (ECF subfamily)
MLASRARRRLRDTTPVADPDLGQQRQVVDAFFAAARAGDFERLVGVLAPDVELRADGGAGRPSVTAVVQGAETVAGRALMFANPASVVFPALVNGSAGVVITVAGSPVAVMAFTVVDGRVAAIDALGDPERLRSLDLAGVTG